MPDTMNTPGIAGWIQHSGPDAAAARKFYSDVVGWTVADMPMQDGSSYTGIMVGDAPIGGFSPQPEANGGWTIYVTVEDVDGAVARAGSGGGKIVSPPADVPGIGRMATIEDPQGGKIAVITYESMQQ